jgi:NAD(P)-dependent dehydrogenase (short-subunit alcohol dehydrogenase family)
MLLEDKVAVIYGAAGAVGTAVANAFARQGARLFLSGRTLEPVERLAAEIVAGGGSAEAARVDALEAEAVESHLAKVVKASGRVDISFNLISLGDSQGQMLTGVSPAAFVRPVETAMRSQIITAGAAARRMVEQRSGVILFLTATPARLPIPATGDFAVACAALEGLSRQFAAELGPDGVRVVCLRSAGSPESPGVGRVMDADAKAAGVTREAFQAQLEQAMPLRRFPSLAEVANVAAIAASDLASPITATVVNLTCGAIAD